MPRQTDSRERMLATAAGLFHRQGYHATGLNQVIAEGGVPKGSLYFHFPGGKEQLAAEALRRSGETMRAALAAELAGVSDVRTGLDRAVGLFATALAESDFRMGCPLVKVATDAAGESEPIRGACADGYAGWLDAIADYLVRCGIAPDKAAGLAGFTLSSFEGALLLAQVRRDSAPLHDAARYLAGTIAAEVN